jgi:hypothetical protein
LLEVELLRSVLTFIFIVVAFVIVAILTTVAYALALPVCLLFALASVIWRGDFPSFKTRKSRTAQESGEIPEEPSDGKNGHKPTRTDGLASEKNALASEKNAIEIGWRSHPDRDVAVRSYYFGPVVSDMVGSASAVWAAARSLVEFGQSMADASGDADWAAIGIVANAGIGTGMALGCALGAVGVLTLSIIVRSPRALACAWAGRCVRSTQR